MPWSSPVGWNGAGWSRAATAAALDAATTAWINAVVADGGAVSATQQSRVDALIVGLKADSLFAVLDRLWLYAGESDTHQAKIDIINLASHTVNGTAAAFGTAGYTGDGSTFWLGTGFVPNAGGHNFLLNSGSVGFYHQSITRTGQQIGSFDSSETTILPHFNGTDNYVGINGGGNSITSNTATNALWHGSRTASNLTTLYRNGSSMGTTPGASVALDASQFAVFARSTGASSADSFTSAQMSAAFIGVGMNSTQAGNLSTRLNTYMTAWGVNVY